VFEEYGLVLVRNRALIQGRSKMADASLHILRASYLNVLIIVLLSMVSVFGSADVHWSTRSHQSPR
jgi:hypothetical protein